ncbi:MAG: sulfurtransferase TusA family protein [Myxococcaceae bacterium]|nr:sulfurtransferase TusA family protein [Myxococcaceae bacterium]MCA3014608.1 sulfurtransferase TusA family protein [Myxococcaceae bacterium]
MRSADEPVRLEVSARLVDARGKPCPMPIVELAKALKGGVRVELWADDPAAEHDLEMFCRVTGRVTEALERSPWLRAVVRTA